MVLSYSNHRSVSQWLRQILPFGALPDVASTSKKDEDEDEEEEEEEAQATDDESKGVEPEELAALACLSDYGAGVCLVALVVYVGMVKCGDFFPCSTKLDFKKDKSHLCLFYLLADDICVGVEKGAFAAPGSKEEAWTNRRIAITEVLSRAEIAGSKELVAVREQLDTARAASGAVEDPQQQPSEALIPRRWTSVQDSDDDDDDDDEGEEEDNRSGLDASGS